jgi:hypothetical protein
MARAGYWLTPPTRLTFIVSVVLMILALLVHYAHVSIASALVAAFENWEASLDAAGQGVVFLALRG